MRPIDADALKETLLEPAVPERGASAGDLLLTLFGAVLDSAPTLDVVSGGVFDQVRWERDIAIGQLNDLGISLGCTAPDVVKVVRCKDCKYAYHHIDKKHIYCHRDGRNAYEMVFLGDDFCSYGERKDNDNT